MITLDGDIKLDVHDFLYEVLSNLPEYSLSLACTKWNYKELAFEFLDEEDGKTYTVAGVERWQDAFSLWLRRRIRAADSLTVSQLQMILDPCDWDAGMVDELVQLAVFEDVVYG